MGQRRCANRAAPQVRRLRDLHTWQPRRVARFLAPVLRCAPAAHPRRRRTARGTRIEHGDEPVVAGGCRRAAPKPRTYAGVERLVGGVERGQGPRSADDHPADSNHRHFKKSGVVDLEAFFPKRERFDLAMRFNAVLAAPGFDQWFEGEPLDPARLLYTADGRPRVAIFSIAHLGDAERMFFVSLLLNQVLGWMRGQTGTTSLRAIVYMDEIAGYFPPVANPPSKAPLLTLLKQGRAFGLGVVLATQNPVDLDYKGLSNIGTWFLGRLQTERDKARVLDGLEGASAGSVDRARSIASCRRCRSGSFCCTTCTTMDSSHSRRAGRCRICAGRCRAIRSAPLMAGRAKPSRRGPPGRCE